MTYKGPWTRRGSLISLFTSFTLSTSILSTRSIADLVLKSIARSEFRSSPLKSSALVLSDIPTSTWLRIAENARQDAKSFYELGDVKSAFVEYGKATIILLKKIPGHPDYRVLPSTTQRQNIDVVSYPYSLCLYNCASVATTTAVGHVHVLY